MQEQGDGQGQKDNDNKVRNKGTGTGRGRDNDEHKDINRDRGTWTEARAWTDKKGQKKYTGTQGQGQEQRANNGGTMTDRNKSIVMGNREEVGSHGGEEGR